MGKLILVTGGARSGKSTYAEKRATELAAVQGGNVMYIATSVPFDEEMQERVKLHQQRRPKGWHTFEGYSNLKRVYECGLEFDVALLDCVTVMITNLIFAKIGDDFEQLGAEETANLEEYVQQEIADFAEAVSLHWQDVVVVTNEVGLGLVPENKLGRIFRDMAGRINQYLATRADEVYMAVCGIPVRIK